MSRRIVTEEDKIAWGLNGVCQSCRYPSDSDCRKSCDKFQLALIRADDKKKPKCKNCSKLRKQIKELKERLKSCHKE